MSMTENEAREVESTLRQLSEDEGVDGYFAANLQCFFADGANAIEFLLEEIQAYRAIGTIEEFKVLKEKNEPKKPNQISKALDGTKFVGLIGRCPNCGHIVAEDNFVCEDCFQVLDWSE